ncbi:MAG: DUF420 domain-containing protein [Natrialbaceae archaeon]|nr:DUF420 domain-containing protein [Natrialbaceae archaeon]
MEYGSVRESMREHPLGATIVLSILGYALVIGTFALDLPYPSLSTAQINLLTHLVAVINTTTVVLLVSGWVAIRSNRIDRHRLAMTGAFTLIMLFLVVYLVRVGGGGEKHIVGVSDPVRYIYLAMLAIHILLSIVAVPVVLYALILGLTHTPAELRRTAHARVGRIAAASWILSLVLGVITYVMLNHIYGYEFA